MNKMIKCKACQAEIAENAKSCPKCGAKNKAKGGCLKIIGITLGGFIVLGAILGKGEKKNAPDAPTSDLKPTVNAVTPATESKIEKVAVKVAVPPTAELATKMLIGGTWIGYNRYRDASDEAMMGTVIYKEGGLCDVTYAGGRSEKNAHWRVKMLKGKLYEANAAPGYGENLDNDIYYETLIVELTEKTLVSRVEEVKNPFAFVRNGGTAKDFVTPANDTKSISTE